MIFYAYYLMDPNWTLWIHNGSLRVHNGTLRVQNGSTDKMRSAQAVQP